ncbi:hypothetical protein [Bradyrhizobium sp. 191]|uniref:hypothetical protein n=1 Tax=Bradyrhizobium sp. 191 TaxID=2782659 RepID=UPI001FFFA009|nr:hypothetical protein [Bradyrhizobium sp. 191]UPJ69674.1 hypothetical protein IVB23_31795 [Bradyrhizobium sp. 191]
MKSFGQTMKSFSFLHLKGIGGQIAALALASTVALHLVVTLEGRPYHPVEPGDSLHYRTNPALVHFR